MPADMKKASSQQLEASSLAALLDQRTADSGKRIAEN